MTTYEKVKSWRAVNKSKVAAQARRYRARHPDKIRAIKVRYNERTKDIRLPREAEQARRRRAADPTGQRIRYERWRAKKEGDLAQLAGRSRPESCEICQGDKGGIVFDHCHARGMFRGWICDRCNKLLGLACDNPELLRALAEYLERPLVQLTDLVSIMERTN
jgi:hypothetical protein